MTRVTPNQVRALRLDAANAFIHVIASHGRRFFSHGDRVSRFELDKRGRVWFVDKYSGRRIYTHRAGRWRGFTQGGTLRDVCDSLRNYIMGRGDLPMNQLGPWPKWFCSGDLWGYGDSMENVRRECAQVRFRSPPPRVDHRHNLAIADGQLIVGVRFTASCSGCFESGEYGGLEHLYPYDKKAQCHVGAGCDECGYTGKRVQHHGVPARLFYESESAERKRGAA